MNTQIKIIPHKKQRYETVGDWFFDEDSNLQIRVSRMSDPRYEFLVAFHELIEVTLCEEAGVTQEEVDEFDMAYERDRKEGDMSEPGDSPKAPYYYQHQFATKLEKEMAQKLNVIWEKYEAEINSL